MFQSNLNYCHLNHESQDAYYFTFKNSNSINEILALLLLAMLRLKSEFASIHMFLFDLKVSSSLTFRVESKYGSSSRAAAALHLTVKHCRLLLRKRREATEQSRGK